MPTDPETFAHQHWLGYVQPVGLVVSVPALLQAQAYVNRNIAPEHQRLLDCLTDDPNAPPAIADLARFTQEVLGWEPADLAAWSADNPDHSGARNPAARVPRGAPAHVRSPRLFFTTGN
jgi:hypothetical protein